MIPNGSKVQHTISNWNGVVVRHVKGKDGGSYRVLWENTHESSLVAPSLLVVRKEGVRS